MFILNFIELIHFFTRHLNISRCQDGSITQVSKKFRSQTKKNPFTLKTVPLVRKFSLKNQIFNFKYSSKKVAFINSQNIEFLAIRISHHQSDILAATSKRGLT
jgi:hypothetical protein